MLFWTLFLGVVAVSLACAERDTSCDDGGRLMCSTYPPIDSRCGDNGLWALQSGCFLCVDATTCIVIDSPLALHEEVTNRQSLLKADSNELFISLQDQTDQRLDGSLSGDPPVLRNTNLALVELARHPKVYNWLFAIPVCLMAVSLVLAVSARGSPLLEMPRQQLNQGNTTEVYNLLGMNRESDDNDVIATAGYYDNSCLCDSEEARCLLSKKMPKDNYAAINLSGFIHV